MESNNLKPKWQGKQIGFVDENGELAFNGALFDDADDFVNGLARVKQNGLWGLIDLNGNPVCPAEYSFISRYNEDKCFAGKGKHLFEIYESGDIIPIPGEWSGVIDEDGYTQFSIIKDQEWWVGIDGIIYPENPKK